MRISLQKTYDGTPEQNTHRVVAAIFGALALMCLLATVLLWFIERSVSGEARLLAAGAVEVQAVVLDRRIEETRNTDKDGHTTTSTSYYLRVEFTTAAGDKVQLDPSVGRERYDASPAGTALTLRYAVADPRVIEFEAGEKAAEAGMLQAVWKVLAAGTALLAALGLWKLRRPVNVV